MHENFIYNGKSVEINAIEALEDADESGFLIPLHYETFREMSLVASTQVATACTYVVFNCYQVVKTKWYQTTIFKILVFVAIIVVTVMTAGVGSAGFGILGANVAIGMALGFTGLIAAIVGAVVNAIAAMILLKLISFASVELFGDKIGTLIAAIVSIVVMQVSTSLMNGASLASSWGNLMSASNIIGMTSAVGNGVAGYIQASAMGIQEKTQDLINDYNQESKDISQLFQQNIGYGRGYIDPMNLTDSSVGNFIESEKIFLSRTLMTGSDIANMTLDMLTNFADYTLNLDKPLN
jgi:hypothetical protein